MKFKILMAAAFWLLMLSLACKSDDLDFSKPAAALSFSRDTVILDTVYNQVRSETYALTVYNDEDKDVVIPQISLENGSNSPYRINVDGKSGLDFRNVPLRKKDSLYVFVEVAPTATAKQALAQDRIVFQTAGGQKYVTLLSVVEDAEFFIESSSNPNILNQNTVWTDKKAKIIYGKLTVAEGKTLDIQAGTRVYFTKNSSLVLSKNSKLNISGDLQKEVVLRGDRNDTRYDSVPLNWKGIEAAEGAVLNINYAKIFGGETGLHLKSATANISNTFIHIFQNYGIQAIASNVRAKNLVMYGFGQAAVGIFKGGNADFTQCTLANYWNFNSTFPANAFYASNEWQNASGAVEYGPLTLTVKNSILFSKKDNGVILKLSANQTASYLFDSSILKMGNNAGFTFENNAFVVNSIKNADPKFLNHSNYKNNFRVAADSPAKGKGNRSAAQTVPVDIVNISRTANPTIGAYQ